MKEIKEFIRSIVRPIVTISLTATLCYLTIIGKIASEYFIGIVSVVIAFWFSDRKNQKEKEAI